ncbi:DUF6114 domain-containing protein [Streptomyces sp. MMG1121]|uniref:DUF6114 domain-containing protein n=1 Tax=Streptomyces sp. MMG1121 TaxID=1415544 RepID=UPI000A9C362C|nr:DUF6114 domain-containing protein [Streptomyces sp. MMG1121]
MRNPTMPAEWREALSRTKHGFRTWRDTRPFWAGLITLSASLPIMYFPYAHLSWGSVTLALSSTAGAASLVIGILLVVLGLLLWFQQNARLFAGIAAILMSLIALPLANFGGLLLGTLPGLIGGSLACAWMAPDGTSLPGDPVDASHEPTTAQNDGLTLFSAPPAEGGPHAQ